MTYRDLPASEQAMYADLDDAAKQWPLERKANETLRFEPNIAVRYCVDRIDLNALWREAQRNEWPLSDVQTFYRQMGYSLSGYLDIFAGKETIND